MKQWSAAIINLLQSGAPYICAHAYDITLSDGTVDHFTDLDMDIPNGPYIYKSNSLRIENMHFKLKVGVEVDEQTVKIYASPTDTLGGVPFLSGAAQGLLDGAWMLRSRVFWPIVTGSTWFDIINPAATWPQYGALSYMRASTITKLGRSYVEMKWKSPLVLLDQQLPHNYYQPSCLWTLYQPADSDGFGCLMVKNNFGVVYTVGSNVTALLVPAGYQSGGYTYNGFNFPADPGGTAGIKAGFTNGVLGSSGPNSADSVPTFVHGRMLFVTGALAGAQFSISFNDGNNFYMDAPLGTVPAPNDIFIAFAGCTKNLQACGLKFGTGASGGAYTAVTGQSYSGNLANFRGFDLAPSEHIGL